MLNRDARTGLAPSTGHSVTSFLEPGAGQKSTLPELLVGAQQDPDADEHGSTCLLIFHAGPPYEDTAFKILNKEWEYSHKKGFKSTFERGILHLYFNFKRNRYRR